MCNVTGCPTPTDSGRCAEHERKADRARGSSTERGYGTEHRTRFRSAVLARDRRCVLCSAPATVADHWPLSRRELVDRGLDPNDPAAGRGLCRRCHSIETAKWQPGGWAAQR